MSQTWSPSQSPATGRSLRLAQHHGACRVGGAQVERAVAGRADADVERRRRRPSRRRPAGRCSAPKGTTIGPAGWLIWKVAVAPVEDGELGDRRRRRSCRRAARRGSSATAGVVPKRERRAVEVRRRRPCCRGAPRSAGAGRWSCRSRPRVPSSGALVDASGRRRPRPSTGGRRAWTRRCRGRPRRSGRSRACRRAPPSSPRPAAAATTGSPTSSGRFQSIE